MRTCIGAAAPSGNAARAALTANSPAQRASPGAAHFRGRASQAASLGGSPKANISDGCICSSCLLWIPAVRISEALTLRVSDVNLEDLLVTLDGKGRKQRVVPFSFELQNCSVSATSAKMAASQTPFCFASRTETMWSRRNALRDVKLLCGKLGFTAPGRTLHAFRHTFAVNYLRRHGSVFHLQKALGHSTLEMTRRYANLVTADLQAVHERVSLLFEIIQTCWERMKERKT